MAKQDLGRVVPLHKGDYSSEAVYELNDIVNFNGDQYWHISHEETTGIDPTNTSVWRLQAGATGKSYSDQAKEQAEIARTNAASASSSASSASASAASASESAKALEEMIPAYNALSDRVATLEASKIKRYSVRFSGSNPSGTREDDAVGMVANVAVDDEIVRNDFDNVSFFDRPICNCTWDDGKEEWRVNAYKGEPGFAWDGSNGEVMYECKPCAYSDNTDLNTYISVTGTPREGYTLFSIFPDWNTKIYLPVFNLVTVDGKAGSRAGYLPIYDSLNGFMTKAKTFSMKAHTETIEALFYDSCLQLVEFATKDVQSIMTGACNMSYNSNTTVIVSTISDKQFTMDSAQANAFVVGQTVSIGSTVNGSDRTAGVVILNIEDSGDGNYKIITLEEEAAGLTSGDFLSSRMWKTGAAAIAVSNASSGSLASNTDGKHPCIYRGKENPWANGFSMICNLLVKRSGAGTDDDPYKCKIYYLPDISKYTNGAITDDYIETNIEIPSVDGYIKLMGQWSISKEIFAPVENGGTTTSYWSARYYAPAHSVCSVRFGGSFTIGRICGFYFNCSLAPSASLFLYAARLLCIPHRGSGGGSLQLNAN